MWKINFREAALEKCPKNYLSRKVFLTGTSVEQTALLKLLVTSVFAIPKKSSNTCNCLGVC